MNPHKDLAITLDKVRKRANLISLINGTIQSCNTETLLHTYKTFVRPLIDYRAVSLTNISDSQLEVLLATERGILRKIARLGRFFPSQDLYNIVDIPPITDRIVTLQTKFVKRAIQTNNPITTRTLTQPPRRITTKPKQKVTFPPARLLSITPDLPDDFIDHLNSLPNSIR
ncbi:uncharacterized protein LOC112906547 [Agrilus planipennis]|uniref:Uncharacterized protein LOC112906547 n=1 Tax=Agrilus planipennis TaxID=224129 RepID=A0A7F5RKV3_AGRPL|nr:uncharacterized protein LOC112906547 [Agrilus planipennis]